MSYRERRLAKAARLREWAASRDQKATDLRARTPDDLRHDIAFITQPGHIPERARMIERDQRAYEHANKATEMDRRASGIEAEADRAIYSDDDDATERLTQRIAELEAERDRLKAYNKTARKGSPDYSLLSERERNTLKSAAFAGQVGHDHAMPRYVLTNLSGNINRQKKRLAALSQPRQPRSITARYDGDCSKCDEPITAGATTITEVESGTWIHARCVIPTPSQRCDEYDEGAS